MRVSRQLSRGDSELNELDNILICGNCKANIRLSLDGECNCKEHSFEKTKNVLHKISQAAVSEEVRTRDAQADGYLAHSKFPTQIRSVKSWLEQAKPGGIALDLGCGPGPYTKLLAERMKSVVGVDFSPASLTINANSQDADTETLFVESDLNSICVKPASISALLMADFLQHLGGRSQRIALLNAAIQGLQPQGRFYLSFFNLNIKNYLRGDVHGRFGRTGILYERLTPSNVLDDLPEAAVVEHISPMNIFHNASLDRIIQKVPFAKYLGRMTVITGYVTD